MSHNAAGIAPHVLSFTPSAFAVAGAATITVNGTKLSTTCQLSMPAALGTVVSGPVLSNISSSQADATWTVDILTPTDVTQTCTVSNGGLDASGVSIDIFHGFSPADLLSNDGQWYDSTDTVNANPQIGNWDPSTDWSGSPGTGFGYGSGATLTTIGGARAFDGNLLATSNPDQYPNGLGGAVDWSIAMVVEVPAAWWASAHHFQFRDYSYERTFGINSSIGPPLIGGAWFSLVSRYWTLTLGHANWAVGHFPSGTPDKFTVIATYKATGQLASMYINGVLAETGTGRISDTLTTSFAITYANGTDLKLGDMLFVEKALTQQQVTDLHSYWATKFGF